jgi:uncharacterized membrane protein (DUF4010 family)
VSLENNIGSKPSFSASDNLAQIAFSSESARINTTSEQIAGQNRIVVASSLSDSISVDKLTQLKNTLATQPAVRAEVVAQAKDLLSNPNYPSTSIIKQIASSILNSEDQTELSPDLTTADQ